MSKKIIFQKCNFNTIYFLFYIIAGIIESFIKYCNHPIFWNDLGESEKPHYFLYFRIIVLYASNISDFLVLIPYFIRKKKLKNNKENEKSQIADLNNEDEKQNESNQLIYNDVKELQSGKRKKLIIINSVIISILDFLFYFFLCLYYIIFDDNQISYNDFNCFGPLYNIFQFVSSYLILKTHFYKLQYFSLFLSIGLFIIIFIFDLIIIIKYQEKIDRITYLFQPIRYLFKCVEYSLGKKVILYGYISIYLLLVIRGLIKFIFVGIFSLFMCLFDKENIKNIIAFLQGTGFLYILSIIILSFFKNIFLWVIIDKFSPNHIPLAICIKQIVDFIISLIINSFNDLGSFNWDLYVRIFLYIILIIGVLIHNEIIVINICGLASDTKYFLDLKVKNEELYSDADEPEVLKKFETFDELEDKNKNDDLKIN